MKDQITELFTFDGLTTVMRWTVIGRTAKTFKVERDIGLTRKWIRTVRESDLGREFCISIPEAIQASIAKYEGEERYHRRQLERLTHCLDKCRAVLAQAQQEAGKLSDERATDAIAVDPVVANAGR